MGYVIDYQRINRIIKLFLGITFLCSKVYLFSNPSNPTVISGTADFGSIGNVFLVSTSTDRTIIEWDGFSINSDEITTFVQPSSTSAVLNRVTSASMSDISGLLSSNGQIFLLNPNGILIGSSGLIDVNALVLSTLDVSNAEFLAAGDMTFSGSSTASIENQGTLSGNANGVFLLGRHIVNSGEVEAITANAIFGAADSILYRTSEKNIMINITAGTPVGTGIDHSGQILANRAELLANGNLYTLAIQHSGATSALKTTSMDGEVYLVAEDGESRVQGQSLLMARGSGSTPGGHIRVLGETVTVQDQSNLLTRSDFGGGDIFIGGSLGGDNPDILNATNTTVGPNVIIESNARISGDGGDVSVFATDTAIYEGSIIARGGIDGGNGATVEISGLVNLTFTGTVDTRAFKDGLDGMLIIDPTDITISGAATAGGSFDGGSPTNTFSGSAAAATLNSGDLNTALQTNNVLVTTASAFGGTGNITIGANTTLNLSSSHTLTLDADNDININNNFTMNDLAGGTSILNLFADNDVNIADPLTGSNLSSINIDAGVDINLTDDISAIGITLNMTAGNNINSSGGTPLITADEINFDAGNDFTVTSSITFTGGGTGSDIVGVAANEINNTSSMTFNNWDTVMLSTTTGDIVIDSGITANIVNTLTFDSGNDLINQGGTNTLNDAAGNVTDIILNADQDITIDSQINVDNFNSATFNAGQDFILNNDFEPDNTTTVTVNAVRNIDITNAVADVIAMNATTLTFSAGNDYTASEPFTTTDVDNVNIIAGNDVLITTPSGQTSVTGADTMITAGNDVSIFETFISNGLGDITVSAGNDVNVGPSSNVSQIGSRLGNVSITTGRDLNVVGGTGGGDRSQIGFSASVVDSNIELTIGRNVNVIGGTANSAVALIGHGFTASGSYEGDIIIHSVSGDVSITGQTAVGGNTRFAQIGHARQGGGTSTFSGDIRGTTVGSPARILGSLTITGGGDSTNYAHFGHGGGRNSNALDSYSGEIRVRAADISLIGGIDSDCSASIGFFAVAQSGGANPITITSPALVQVISDSTLDMTANSNGTVSIGSYVLNNAAHPAVVSLDLVDVQTGGNLTMTSGSGTETEASIGAFSTNPASDTNLSMNIGGDLIITSGTGANAQITNGIGSTDDLDTMVIVSGDITLSNNGAFSSFIESVTGDLTVIAGGAISLPAVTRIENLGGSDGTMSVTGGSFLLQNGGFIRNAGLGATSFRTTSGNADIVGSSFITSMGNLTGNVALDLNLIDDAMISTAGTSTISVVRDIDIIGSAAGASFLESTGAGTYNSGGTIWLTGNSSAREGFIQNTTGNLLVVAGENIEINIFGRIENLGMDSLTLVVDNLFPSPPQFGPGFFELSSLGTVGSLGAGPLRIFTSVRSQNSIAGTNNLNGTTFVAGPLFVNSPTEQWGVYFPSNFGGTPFTIFYKNSPTPTPADIVAIDPDAFIPFYELFYILDGYGMDPSVAWMFQVCICDCRNPCARIFAHPDVITGGTVQCCWRLPPYLHKLDLRPYYH